MLDLESDIEVTGEAATAEEALEELQTLDSDLVLMDIGLPGMDGVAATSALKERHAHLPVVMLTSHRDEHVAEAVWAGASGYILKSATRRQLVEAIRAADRGEFPIDPAVAASLFTNAGHGIAGRRRSR